MSEPRLNPYLKRPEFKLVAQKLNDKTYDLWVIKPHYLGQVRMRHYNGFKQYLWRDRIFKSLHAACEFFRRRKRIEPDPVIETLDMAAQIAAELDMARETPEV